MLHAKERTRFPCQVQLTMAICKSFDIYRQLLFHSDAFAKAFPRKCFIFKEIHGKDANKVSHNFEVIKLNWVRISRTNEKTGSGQNEY